MSRNMLLKRGLYPLLIKVLLVAIILLSSLMLLNYVLSAIFTTKESFEIKPLLYIAHAGVNPEPMVVLYVINDGGNSERLLRVEIRASGGAFMCDIDVTVEAGFRGYLIISSPDSAKPLASGRTVPCNWVALGNPAIEEGRFYTVRLYTVRHGIITLELAAQRA